MVLHRWCSGSPHWRIGCSLLKGCSRILLGHCLLFLWVLGRSVMPWKLNFLPWLQLTRSLPFFRGIDQRDARSLGRFRWATIPWDQSTLPFSGNAWQSTRYDLLWMSWIPCSSYIILKNYLNDSLMKVTVKNHWIIGRVPVANRKLIQEEKESLNIADLNFY